MLEFADIRAIRDFKSLIKYLRTRLDWPVDEENADALTFEYEAKELGLDEKSAVKIRDIKQLRPLADGQPWGIFWIDFEPKRLPVVVMRRVLGALVIKKRGSREDRKAAWNLNDLMFISATGEGEERGISFAHFQQESDDLPTLRVLGWDGADTVLKLDHTALTLHEQLRWPDDPHNSEAWRQQWSGIFRHRLGHVIRTADALADRLAILARGIRDASLTLMEHESEQGPLHLLYKAFQTALIHDLTKADFTDTYAQTVTYGLLTAAISRTDMSGGAEGTALVAENITDMVPVTNPFLREMLETFLKVGGGLGGINFDELGVQNVVELLRGDETDLPAILRDFGNKTQGEDPVIHFYEHFLSAYNKKLKIQRGVFYTPRPVVSYIVRNVHELLQTEFGLEDGLASTITWNEMSHLNPDIKIPESVLPDSPFIQILDPATGTATFLVEIIDVIFRTLTTKWNIQGLNKGQQKIKWNEYVPRNLLPRLHGYEIMMAPYAIAHMKIGLKLYETGYFFRSNERARIYLTNTLETPQDFTNQFNFMIPALAHEAQAVDNIKRFQRFTIILGNPPYSNLSANLTSTARDLVEKFKNIGGEKVIERNALQLERNLNDDYVKFIAWSESRMEETGLGILSMISNNVYTRSPSLRGMRAHLLSTFSRINILNLHGASQRGPADFRFKEDENVFDIEQPVAIGIFCSNSSTFPSIVQYSELIGERNSKYQALLHNTFSDRGSNLIKPKAPSWLFIPAQSEFEDEYNSFFPLPAILPLFAEGIKTGHDWLVIDFESAPILRRIEDIRDSREDDNELCKRIGLSRKKAWNFAKARVSLKNGDLKSFIVKHSYRAFDERYIFYHPDWVASQSSPVMHNLPKFTGDTNRIKPFKNIALLAGRISRDQKSFLYWCSSTLTDKGYLSSLDNVSVFPALVYSVPKMGTFDFGEFGLTPNFSKEFEVALNEHLGFKMPKQNVSDLPQWSFTIISYLYSILWSQNYRIRYSSLLYSDFPRIPLTRNLALFQSLIKIGRNMIEIHLMDSPILMANPQIYNGLSNPIVEKISYKDGTIWFDADMTSGFSNVSQPVWNFTVGSYQICEKWLKDRRGRQLSQEDILHYQKIILAIQETIRLMGEIDAVIEEHGGWPIQ